MYRKLGNPVGGEAVVVVRIVVVVVQWGRFLHHHRPLLKAFLLHLTYG